MKKSKDRRVTQPPAATVERRRWSVPRSPLAASVSPVLRAAVRKLDQTRAELVAAMKAPTSSVKKGLG